MKPSLRKCCDCGRYTTCESCPECGSATKIAAPPKFSPDDRYGEYRRKGIKEEYGKNGKLDHL